MDFNFVLPSHGNPIVLDWIKEGKAVFQPGPLETPCLVWQGGKLGKYGRSKEGRTHRIAINCPDNFHSLHACDNPPCCNPWHLREGTHEDNMRDYEERGLIPLLMRVPFNMINWSIKGSFFIETDESMMTFDSKESMCKYLMSVQTSVNERVI